MKESLSFRDVILKYTNYRSFVHFYKLIVNSSLSKKSIILGFLLFSVQISVKAQICDPNHWGAWAGNSVESVTIGAWTQSNAGGDGQKNDYTGGTDATMTQGTDYNFSVTFKKVATLSYGYVYVDWNNDGDFEDASEEVLNYQSVGSGAGTTVWTDATYTCPSIATGTVTMRVISSVYVYTTSTDGCYAWDYGEFEDYEIVVSAAAGPNVKDNNTTDLDDDASWTTAVPTSSEVATWESTVTGANTTVLGSSIEFQGIAIEDVGGAVTVNSGNTLTIGTDGIDMSSADENFTVNCSVALGSNQNWEVATSRTLTATGVVSGSNKISKLGAGTLTLSGTNTFTGGVDHNAGTLNIDAAAALGTTAGTFTIADEATIDNTSGGAITTSNYPITISDDFTFTGSNNLNLGTGATALSATSTITTSAGTLELGGVVSGSFGIVKAGAGALTLSGTNTFTGGVTHNAGTLNIASADALGTTAGTFTIAGGTTINNTSGGILTTSNYPIAINGSFTFAGTNSLNLGTGAVTLGSNTTITASASTFTIEGVISGAYDIVKEGPSHIELYNESNTYTGKTSIVQTSSSVGAVFFKTIKNVGGGASSLGAPTTVGNGTIAVGSGAFGGKLMFTGTSDQTTDRVIDLASTTGEVQISAGASANLIFTSDFTATGAGSKTLALRGSTAANEIQGVIVNNSGGNTTSLDKREAGTWILSGDNTYTGTTTISDGTLQIGNSGTTGSVASTSIVNSGALIIDRSDAIAYSGVISGTGSFQKKGAGTLTISGTNTYTGTTTVTAGTLKLGAADVIADGSDVVLSGGIIETDGNDETMGTLDVTTNSKIALGAGSHTLTFAASDGETWGADVLTITGWTGGYDGTSGTGGKIFTGSSAELSGAKLAKIGFYNGSNTYTATQLGTGEIVPTGTLPVELVSFEGERNGSVVDLTWETASELNNSHFNIEKSSDGKNWKKIGEVEGSGTTSDMMQYFFTDYIITEAINYYRLKQVDYDGKYEYSGVVMVKNEASSLSLTVYPNPSSDYLNVIFETNESKKMMVNMVNQNGSKVFESAIYTLPNENKFSLPVHSLQPGIYYLQIIDDNELLLSTNFVVKR